ncbi:MAG TPA: phosphate acyltransferase PlsX [Chloroflexota bacterium]
MRIALDAMGGDHAPRVPVEGAVQAVATLGVEVLLVGQPDALERELARFAPVPPGVQVVPAPDAIGMDEHPVAAVRQKPGSSLVVGLKLVRDGEAAAFVSAGNTGAVMAGALFILGRLPDVDRPPLATVFPTLHGHCLLLDVGANADCRPEHLVQFALMGSVYQERVLGRPEPRVALLSIGEEETKGNLLTVEAHRLLRASALRFVGNVEGKDVPHGVADVIVCDGFVGNVVIKLAEGLGGAIFQVVREEVSRDALGRLAGLLLRPAFRRVRRRFDYAEYGGAPLLGVRGVVIVAHGRSNATAIRNAIRVAQRAVDEGLVQRIEEGLRTRPSVPARPPASESGGP